ncbi:MAG: SDR family NAD(P)-dependent oxidoreductase, partial [Abditibacteriaceae bacterium]
MQADLSNQVALVTGAARGIGQAIADNLATNGARVIYADIDEPAAQKAAAASNASALAVDVSCAESVEKGVAQVLAEYGQLDILVNNAGINTLKHRVTIDEFPLEEWERILKVDLNGVFLMSRAAAKVMSAQGSGRIINIASVAGMVPLRLQSAFVAAKAGVVNLTRAMALELGPRGVLVNGIAPGSVLTDATRQLFYGEDGSYHDSVQQLIAHIPLARPGTPKEIACA